MRYLVIGLGLILLTASLGLAKPTKIRGYVTEVHSATAFDIDDYRVMRDESLTLEFDKEDDDTPGVPKDIRIGTEVEIKGDFDESTHELKAKSVKIFPTDSRQ